LRPWAVAVEFQIAASPMFGRLLKYLGALWDDLRPDPEPGSRYDVAAVVVNLTGRGQSSHASSWKKLKLHTELGIGERNLAYEDGEAELSRVEKGEATRVILPLIALMQKGDDPVIIERWKQAAAAERDARRRATLGALALVLSEAADRQTVWKDFLKEWNVTKSTIVEEWTGAGSEVRFGACRPERRRQRDEGHRDLAALAAPGCACGFRRRLSATGRRLTPESLIIVSQPRRCMTLQ
jgi:hypothetical protein